MGGLEFFFKLLFFFRDDEGRLKKKNYTCIYVSFSTIPIQVEPYYLSGLTPICELPLYRLPKPLSDQFPVYVLVSPLYYKLSVNMVCEQFASVVGACLSPHWHCWAFYSSRHWWT